MSNMEKNPSSKVRIRFQDCDPFNHLNNASYLNYFMNAREDQLIEYYDLNIFDHAREFGKAWVVGTNQVMYIKPALLMEEVLIDTRLIDYAEKQLTAEMQMWSADRSHLKAILWGKFMYVDLKTGSLTEHDDALMDFFGQIAVPVSETVFEQRCASILAGRKKTAAV